MTILGLIVEYNPFHNGHLYHLQKAKKLTKSDVSIAVMSGSFVQRGEPALLDKWTRTRMALESGVDLVVELPTVYSTQSADWFAFGAVSLLHELHVDHLVFGSEMNSIQNLKQISDILYHETDTFKLALKKNLSFGHSYPKALSLTFQESQNSTSSSYLYPNDILGVQYILQIQKLKSNIKPQTIGRKISHYHDTSFSEGPFTSATSIRKKIIEENELTLMDKYVPSVSYHYIQKAIKNGRVHSWENYYHTLRILLQSHSCNELKKINGMNEGIEKRLKEAAQYSASYREFILSVQTKRYTLARIQRGLVHLLLNLTADRIAEMQINNGPQYIRILGFTEKGRAYLNNIKNQLNIPLVTKVSKLKPDMLDFDIQASQIYELGFRSPSYQLDEYKQKPVIIQT